MFYVVKDYIRGRTCFNQDFQLDIVKSKLFQKYDVHLVVISIVNERKFFHIKLNKKRLTYPEALELSKHLADVLESKKLNISYNYGLPLGHKISLTKDLITLVRLPSEVLSNPAVYLNPGDELYVRCQALNVHFYHSGIYIGDNKVIHFMADLAEDRSIFELMVGPGRIHNDTFIEYVYSNLDLDLCSNISPTIYKVVYPLAVRSSDRIINKALEMYLNQEKLTYDIRQNNCQHFSSYCSVGQPWSYDMASSFKNVACSILELGFASKKASLQSSFFGSLT